jgi:hypothetical protein
LENNLKNAGSISFFKIRIPDLVPGGHKFKNLKKPKHRKSKNCYGRINVADPDLIILKIQLDVS